MDVRGGKEGIKPAAPLVLPTSCLKQGAELLSHLYINYLQVISGLYNQGGGWVGGWVGGWRGGREFSCMGGVCSRWAGFVLDGRGLFPMGGVCPGTQNSEEEEEFHGAPEALRPF